MTRLIIIRITQHAREFRISVWRQPFQILVVVSANPSRRYNKCIGRHSPPAATIVTLQPSILRPKSNTIKSALNLNSCRKISIYIHTMPKGLTQSQDMCETHPYVFWELLHGLLVRTGGSCKANSLLKLYLKQAFLIIRQNRRFAQKK